MLGDRFQIKDKDGNTVEIKTQEKQQEQKRQKKTSDSQSRHETKETKRSKSIFDFLKAGLEMTMNGIVRPIVWGAKKLAPYAKKAYVLLTTKKDKDTGERHFNRKRALISGAILAAWCMTLPIQTLGLYYYTTLQTLENVYIPDAAVFINQQHVEPGKRSMLSARDEIYTVMGKHVREDGTVEPIRFDIDFNPFFFFYADAMRPDLAASKLNSQSPYGIKATVKVTGMYARLPRSFRIKALRWLDLRSEIVKVEDVVEVSGLPPFVKTDKDVAEWTKKPGRPITSPSTATAEKEPVSQP